MSAVEVERQTRWGGVEGTYRDAHLMMASFAQAVWCLDCWTPLVVADPTPRSDGRYSGTHVICGRCDQWWHALFARDGSGPPLELERTISPVPWPPLRA